MSARRVLFIAYDFPPCADVGAQASAQVARHLPSYGWDPIVLTATEDEFERRGIGSAAFEGEVYRVRSLPHPLHLYRRLLARLARADARLDAEGVPVQAEGIGLKRWVLSLLLVPDAQTTWALPAILRGRALTRRHAITHLFSSGPCWTNHLVALGLARWTGLSWTAHFRDPWLQSTARKPTSAVSKAIERSVEARVLRRADAVVCVTRRHSEELQRLYSDLPAAKFFTVSNGFDEEEWRGLSRSPNGATEFRITYAGSLYLERSLTPLLRALRMLADTRSLALHRVKIRLIGWWTQSDRDTLRALAGRYGMADGLEIVGPWQRRATLQAMIDSDLLLVLAEGLTLQVPQKTYEYLRAGRPILALTPADGALAQLLRTISGGFVVDPADESGVADVIASLYERWCRREPPPVPDVDTVARFERMRLAGCLADVLTRTVTARS